MGLIGRRCSLIFSSSGSWDLGWALGGGGTRGSALSGCGLDLHDKILATGRSAGKLSLNTCKTCIGGFLLVVCNGRELLLNLSVVGTGLLSRVSSLVSSAVELLLNQRLLAVKSLLLQQRASLSTLQGLLIVSLGLFLDAAEDLSLTLLSVVVLLLNGLLDSLLLSSLSRVTPLADEHHFLVLLASLLLDTTQLKLSLGLGSGLLLADDIADSLAKSALLRGLALFGEADSVKVLTHLLDL